MNVKKVYSVVGAGGKTTFINEFAQHIINFENVLVSSSTKMRMPDKSSYNFIILPKDVDESTLDLIADLNPSLQMMFVDLYPSAIKDRFLDYFDEYYYTKNVYMQAFPDFKVYPKFPSLPLGFLSEFIVLINLDNLEMENTDKGRIYYFIHEIVDGKIAHMDQKDLGKLNDIFKYIIIEADGADGKRLKVPKDHEPVILDGTTDTLMMLDISTLDEKIGSQLVYNLDKFLELTGKNLGDKVEFEDLEKLVQSEEYGSFRGYKGRRVLIVNKISTEYEYALKEQLNELMNANKLQTNQTVKVIGRKFRTDL